MKETAFLSICVSVNSRRLWFDVSFFYSNYLLWCSSYLNSMETPNKMSSLPFDLPLTMPWIFSATKVLSGLIFSCPCPSTSHFSTGPLGSVTGYPQLLADFLLPYPNFIIFSLKIKIIKNKSTHTKSETKKKYEFYCISPVVSGTCYFLWSHPLSLAFIIFPQPLLHRSLGLEGRAVIHLGSNTLGFSLSDVVQL